MFFNKNAIHNKTKVNECVKKKEIEIKHEIDKFSTYLSNIKIFYCIQRIINYFYSLMQIIMRKGSCAFFYLFVFLIY